MLLIMLTEATCKFLHFCQANAQSIKMKGAPQLKRLEFQKALFKFESLLRLIV